MALCRVSQPSVPACLPYLTTCLHLLATLHAVWQMGVGLLEAYDPSLAARSISVYQCTAQVRGAVGRSLYAQLIGPGDRLKLCLSDICHFVVGAIHYPAQGK